MLISKSASAQPGTVIQKLMRSDNGQLCSLITLRSGIILTAIFLLLAGIGCGKGGLRRVVVTGQVTHRGQPLKNGQIMFSPLEGTQGQNSVASILNGAYRLDSKGGVPIGKHKIIIEGYRPPTYVPAAEASDYGREQYLPAKYNNASDLTIELSASESIVTKDFELKD